MKYTAQAYSPETESAKTVRLVFASLAMLLVLFAFSDSMLTIVLIWLTIGCAAAAVSSMLATVIRHFTQRISRETIMFAVCGLTGACLAAGSLHRIAEAGCSCEFAAGHSSDYLYFFVPPLTAVALVYLITGIVRGVAGRRSKPDSETATAESA